MTIDPNSSSTPDKQEDNNLSINQYKDIVDHANQQIDRVRFDYKWIGSLLVLLLIFGMYFTFNSRHQFIQEMRDNFKELKQEVETKVEKELGTEQIKDIIKQKVSVRIDIIADKIIDKQITTKIEPKIREIESKLADINTESEKVEQIIKTLNSKIENADSKLTAIKVQLKEAIKTRKELSEIANITINIIAAQNDDRQAFNTLSSWSKDLNFQFNELALNAVIQILGTYAGIFDPPYMNLKWRTGIKPNNLTFIDLKTNYNNATSALHPALLNYIWKREDIPKKEKMKFLAEILQEDKSLTATFYAGKFLSKEASIKWNAFKIDPVIEWWNQNKETMEYK